MQAIATAIGYVLQKIVGALEWFGRLAVAAFEAVWMLLQDIVCWVLEQVLGLAVSILGAFDLSALTAHLGAWAQLPASMVEVMNAVGLGPAVGIVVSALGIRVVLQLIPFTRLGS